MSDAIEEIVEALEEGEVTTIEAPWTDAEVGALNAWQTNSDFHPFTCPADGSMGSLPHGDDRILVAYNEGWQCGFPGCGYGQTWAHVLMAAPEPDTYAISDDASVYEQVEILGRFIMEQVPGEPSRSEGAVECAIRIIKELTERTERTSLDTERLVWDEPDITPPF